MSCVIVLAPIVVASWPVMTASIVAAATAAGFTLVKQPKLNEKTVAKRRRVMLELENAQAVEESLRADDQLVVERQGVRVTFSRNARGRFSTCVEGTLPDEELKAIGEDLSGRVIQQYVYRRLASELAGNGFQTVSEEVGSDQEIRLHVRRYEE
jgi:hypothetical protein